MRLPLLFCCTLTFYVASAQKIEKILNNPDVIWAAYITLDFVVEPEYIPFQDTLPELNRSLLLHAEVPDGRFGEQENVLFASKFLANMLNPGVLVYDASDAIEPMTVDEREFQLMRNDTVMAYNFDTQMEEPRAVQNDINPYDLEMVRVRQLLYYVDKADEFRVLPLAYAPVRHVVIGFDNDNDNESMFWHAPLWFKMPDNDKILRKNKGRFTLVRRLTTVSNSPNINELKVLKDFKPPVAQQLLNRVRKDEHYEVFHQYAQDRQVPIDELERMILTLDTFVTFDPETYEERVMIERNEITGEEVVQMCLVQDWMWDDRRKQLVIKPIGFAPMVETTDQHGNFRFLRLLFWRFYD